MGLTSRRSQEQGFTLIELMITMLILSILVTIVVLTMAFSRNRAQEATCKANLRTLYDSINVFESIYGRYPNNLDELLTPPSIDGQTPREFLKPSLSWTCPAGGMPNGSSDDYRDYYTPATGHTSCPRASHNP